MSEDAPLGTLAIKVIRPHPHVAFIETKSPVHAEYFFAAVGEHSLSISVLDTGEKSLLEPRVHVFHKPYNWDMTPTQEPPSPADDHNLLVQVWQLLGSG